MKILSLAQCLAPLGAAAALCAPGLAAELTLVHPPLRPDTGSMVVHCGSLIDGTTPRARRDLTITIRDGHVASVTPGTGHDPTLPFLELRDYTCLPGLIDMHTHLTEEPEVEADLTVLFTRSLEETQAIGTRHAGATLAAGFTTVRDVGTYTAWSDRTLRNAINEGEVAGPRMQIAGFYLTIPGGGGDIVAPGHDEKDIPARVRVGVTRGPENFAARAQLAADGGAGVIKVIASGAVLAYGGVPGAREMTREEITAAARVAHDNHIRLAAHAHGAESIKDAILAGADTIEHASYIDDEGIALAKSHHTALSMDIYNGDYTDVEGRKQHWPAEFLRKNLESTDAQRQRFKRAHAAGATIVFGTDAGVYPHGLNARQFPIMVRWGMTPMEAIQAATSVAARYLGWSDRVGRVAPGQFGDLIAVRKDPLQDISSLESVDVVIKGGLPFKLPSATGAVAK